jgi:hypothetical protein
VQAQTLIALDYCHKIKCYFNGFTEEDVKTIIKKGREDKEFGNCGTERVKIREIGRLFERYWVIRSSIGKAKHIRS